MWICRFSTRSLLALAILTSPAQATILTFDADSFCSSWALCLDYGDRVTTTNDLANGFRYGEGNGFTPNVVTDYDSSNGNLSLYTFNYGTVPALGNIEFGVPGSVTFTADSGFLVSLNSFVLSAWVSVPNPDTTVRILDGSDNVLFENVFTAVASQSYPFNFGSEPLVAEIIRIEINNIGDTAISNIDFDQAVIPVPAAVWLFGSALGLLGWARRKAD